MKEVMNDMILTDLFWDCECEYDFIHHKSVNQCSICGAEKEEQPNSRVNEVEEILGKELEDLQKQMEHCYGLDDLARMYQLGKWLDELDDDVDYIIHN